MKSAADKNNDISAIDKFNYSHTLLEDSAFSAISGLTLSVENYRQALEILQPRYGNDHVFISVFILHFVQIPKPQNSNDIKRLKFLCVSVHNLKSLRVETSSYSSLIVPLLNKKLPNDLRVFIGRNFENNI